VVEGVKESLKGPFGELHMRPRQGQPQATANLPPSTNTRHAPTPVPVPESTHIKVAMIRVLVPCTARSILRPDGPVTGDATAVTLTWIDEAGRTL
jgi:hypothetical protein